jgi:ABC-type sulfate/molybdate transport systems ATPase subunit
VRAWLLSVRGPSQAGKTYLLRYVNDDKGTVVLEDKGDNYDTSCLKAREYAKERC